MAAARKAGNALAYALLLRRELSERNRRYVAAHGIAAYESYGELPVVVYEPSEDGRSHGNFPTASYRAILDHPQWRQRLEKAHSQARTALPRNRRGCWKELESSNSSDALLMNIFCYPETLKDGRVCSLLGQERQTAPEFGFKARVPLTGNRFDRTEVDMRFGSLLVEAKLTEIDFQQQSAKALNSYRDFAEVFETRRLPRQGDRICGYQLIRNVLAAHASGRSFCVLLDARRPDLREAWYAVMKCVRPVDLRLRCKVLTWQELEEVLPAALQEFLAEKYGITTCEMSRELGIAQGV